MKKGKDTKYSILDSGFEMAGRLGLENVTIGGLASVMSMSKSGLFAHFHSKKNLQLEILNHAVRLFSENVIVPSLKSSPGIARIKALVDNWIGWCSGLTGGCIFVSTASEYSDRSGKLRDFLKSQQEEWLEFLRRMAQSAIENGDFRKNIDCDQFAFDLYSLLLGFNLYSKLLNSVDTKKRQEVALKQLFGNYR